MIVSRQRRYGRRWALRAPRLGSILVLLPVVAGCGGGAGEVADRVVVDLASAAPAAEDAEPADLDLGTAAARPHLGVGWSWNERGAAGTFVWGLAPASEIGFFVSRVRPLVVELRGAPFPRAASQRLGVEANGEPVATLELEPGLASYRVTVPPDALVAGENRLTLRYSTGRRPDAAERRPLAVVWDRITFLFDPATTPAAELAGEDSRWLAAGTAAAFLFEARRGDLLLADGIAGDGALDLWLETDDGRRRLASWPVGDGPWRAELGVERARAVRLTLVATPRSDGTGGIRLERPRVARAAARGRPDAGEGRPPASAAAATRRRPHLLVYLVDTLRADRLGLYGHPGGTSPVLDAFAADAVVFEEVVAQSSWTKPSVASIFTGQPPTAHRVNHRDHRLPEELSTLAERLAAAGWSTAGFAANAYFTEASGLRRGFSHFTLTDRTADVVNRLVFDWLDDRPADGVPLFLYVHTIDPHAPYQPPAAWRHRFAPSVPPEVGTVGHIRAVARSSREPRVAADLLALYDAEVAFNDAMFGELLDGLAARGIDPAEMLVVFLSDHGEGFDDHGFLGHGWDLHREALRVPMVIRLPGGAPSGGHRVAEPVQHVDLLPTFLDLVGLAPDGTLPGRSLAPLMAKGAAPAEFRRPLVSYLDYDGREGASAVAGRFKAIEPLVPRFLPARRLFDRVTDPAERRDLAASRPVTAAWLAWEARRRVESMRSLPAPESEEVDAATRAALAALGYVEE